VSLIAETGTMREGAGEAGSGYIAKEAVSSAIGGAATALEGPSLVIGVGVAAAASVMINQASYQSRRTFLREMYKDEVAAQLGKSPKKIKDRDIDLVAKGDPARGISGNKVIEDELSKLKKLRNVGMLVTVASLLGTVAVMMTITAGFSTAGLAPLAMTGAYVAKGFAGFAIHKVLESPLKWASKKLFNLNELTTHERIEELRKEHRKGKVIARAQVLDVFISANDDLGQFVKSQYGKSFDKLSSQEKQSVVEAVDQHIPITKIAENLNAGRVKVSELAFAVEGKVSGVAPSSVKDPLSLVGKARFALRGVGERLQRVKHHHVETVASTAPQIPTQQKPVVEYDNPTPARSFVERYEAERATPVSRTLH
jgi:hypothetical protein